MPSNDQMDPTDSTHSLLSGGSEMGSRYMMETGIYMSSFAATIFISALVAVGLLLFTILAALTIMLQSCETKNGGVIQHWRKSERHDFCDIFLFHAELNKLEFGGLPAICKEHVIQYLNEGGYLHDLNLSIQVAESYFNTLAPGGDGLDVILVDFDCIFATETLDPSIYLHHRNERVQEVKQLGRLSISRLYINLHKSGWSLVPFTRAAEKHRNVITNSFLSSGLGGWPSLIMRSDNEMLMDSWEYVSKIRVGLHNQGYRIMSVISSRMDAITGPCVGKRNFKLPDLVPYRID